MLVKWNKVVDELTEPFCYYSKIVGMKYIKNYYTLEFIEYDIANKEVFDKYNITQIPTILIDSEKGDTQEFVYYDYKFDCNLLKSFIQYSTHKLLCEFDEFHLTNNYNYKIKNSVSSVGIGPSSWNYDSDGNVITGATGPAAGPTLSTTSSATPSLSTTNTYSTSSSGPTGPATGPKVGPSTNKACIEMSKQLAQLTELLQRQQV
jgi:hypothetical protein